jgi:hypothetical protein
MENWEPKPPGTLWATLGLLRDSFTFFTLPSTLRSRKWSFPVTISVQFDVEYKLQGTLLRIFLLSMITGLFSDPNVSLAPYSTIHSIYALQLDYEETELHTHIKQQKTLFLYCNLFMHALKSSTSYRMRYANVFIQWVHGRVEWQS